tara:strand:- start:678 stop:965 length:288 start_codon:yes stop_codon:yes gene_type:complete
MARPYNRQQMIEALQRAYPNQHIKTSEEFGDSYQGGIWLSGEDGTVDRSGSLIFDYYAEGSNYEFGVVKHLNAYVQRHGWYFEWYDGGTMMMWLD